MAERAIDLVVSDLDGTFLDDDKQVSEINERAIRTAAAMGVPAVFATGRPARWLQPLEPLYDVRPWGVTSNGALIKSLADDEILHVAQLPTDATLEVTHDLKQTFGDRAAFAFEYVEGWGREPEYYLRGDFVEADAVDHVDEIVHAGIPLKLLVRGLGIDTETLAEAAAPIIGDRLTMTFSFQHEDGLLEVSRRGVSKAYAIDLIMSDLGISPSRTAAFGDMPNDMAMLSHVGHPYAMANAHPTLQAAGFGHAGSNNDSGVGRTVLELLGAQI